MLTDFSAAPPETVNRGRPLSAPMPDASLHAVDDSPQSPELTMPGDDNDVRCPRSLPDPVEQPPALLALPPSLLAAVEAVKPNSPSAKARERRLNLERMEGGRTPQTDRNDGRKDADVERLDPLPVPEECDPEPLQKRPTIEPKTPSASGGRDGVVEREEQCPLTDKDVVPDLEQPRGPVDNETVHAAERTPLSENRALEQPSLPAAMDPISLESSPQLLEMHAVEPPSPPPDHSSQYGSSSPSEPHGESFCHRCVELYEENDDLSRKVARLRLRLRGALELAQTHGQRLLRAAYQEKIQEMTQEHAQKTTKMLNMQKKCFEDELEAVDAESQATIVTLTRERDAEREARTKAEDRFQSEREAALEKTTATMVAVQRKMTQLHARATRLEREKKSLVATVSEKQVMIEVLASAAAAKDVERRRMDLLSKTQEEERERKDNLIEALQTEVGQLREKLGQERQVNLNLITQMDELEGERDGDREQHKDDLDDCKQQSKKEVDRLGRLFASMMQDFANVQSDVSTND